MVYFVFLERTIYKHLELKLINDDHVYIEMGFYSRDQSIQISYGAYQKAQI